jgi:cystathionine beta-synthase
MAQEKIFHLKALGAEVRLTRSDVGKGHPEYYQDMAERIAAEEDAWFVNQFGNEANPKAHETTTGPEMLAQMDGDLDAVVCGVGSGGTITGLGRFFRKASPKTKLILADPEGSILARYVETGEVSEEVGSWIVEGIGEDFIPPVSDLSLAHAAYTVSDRDALHAARELLRSEGILAGSSSGTLIAAALRYCRAQTSPQRVVAFVCDSGNKYLSKMYNDFWMRDQGFVDEPATGDLRDLIARKHAERATVTCAPEDTLAQALGRMKLYDVSQLPVLDAQGRAIGLVDESDILLTVFGDERRFRDTVASAMTEKLETVAPSAAVEDLLPIFERDHVAIVADAQGFHGLITRIDLLNHLRRQMP